MTLLEAAFWGLFGGFAVEGFEFIREIRRTPSGWPWSRPGHPGLVPFVISVAIRFTIGAGLAVAGRASGQFDSALSAMAIGVAAPLIIELVPS